MPNAVDNLALYNRNELRFPCQKEGCILSSFHADWGVPHIIQEDDEYRRVPCE